MKLCLLKALRRSELVLQEMTSFIPNESALLKLDGSQTRELLEREEAIELMEMYIAAVLKKDKGPACWSLNGKGWKVCATVAASGMGKSALLETVALRQLQVKGRRVLYVTYSTETFQVPGVLLQRGTPHGVACSLLWAAGAKEEDLQQLEDVSPKNAVAFIRKAYKMNEEDALVVFVDELVQLEVEAAKRMLKEYMSLQGQCLSKIAIVFSSFSTTQLCSWSFVSGRELYPVPLGVLDPQKVAEALAEEAKGVKGKEWLRDIQKKSWMWQVVQGVAVHPRTAFTYLPASSLNEELQLHLQISNLIAQNTNLEDHARKLWTHVPQLLAKPSEFREGLEGLLECGIIRKDEDSYRIEAFMIRFLAFMPNTWSGKSFLCNALLADLQVSKRNRVFGEDVAQNFEVLLRQGFGQDLVTLGELFRGAVCQRLPKKGFKLSPAKQPNHWIAKVGSFKEVNTVRKLLEAGSLVVSGNVGEAGIEHISPLFNEENKLVAVLAYQVKSGTTPDPKSVRELIEAARKAGEKAVPKCQIIPVIMTNYEADTVDRKAVQLLGAGFHKWLRPLMPLRMKE